MTEPWAHQAVAADLAHSGRHVVLSTGTASGKSLAYLLPIIAATAEGRIVGADPERDVAFAFVTNSLGPYVLMDPRAQKLARLLGSLL